MPRFSETSLKKLDTCHPDLIILFKEVVKNFDCVIVCGHRNEEAQNRAFDNGFSKVQYPDSKHNSIPSMAADVIPYPVNWKDLERMKFFAGYVLGIAQKLFDEGKMTHKVISGLDWDADTELKDTTFKDHPHYQLKL